MSTAPAITLTRVHLFQNSSSTFQSTPEERLSIVGGKRPPQFYMPSYEAEIPESQKKDSDIISVKAKSFADREIRYTLKAQGQGAAARVATRVPMT